jgi:hypothetical protein
MNLIIDPLAITTFRRLAGVEAFVRLLDSMPEVEWQEREALKHIAQEQDWDFGDFSLEDQQLDDRFLYWIP